MTVVISPRADGNWTLICDWAIPNRIQIEDGELHELQERLNDLFSPKPFTTWLQNSDLAIQKDHHRVVFRQVGWLGHTANHFYSLHQPPTSESEPGGFSPIYQQIESD
jgi:hypothetical protein